MEKLGGSFSMAQVGTMGWSKWNPRRSEARFWPTLFPQRRTSARTKGHSFAQWNHHLEGTKLKKIMHIKLWHLYRTRHVLLRLHRNSEFGAQITERVREKPSHGAQKWWHLSESHIIHCGYVGNLTQKRKELKTESVSRKQGCLNILGFFYFVKMFNLNMY